MDKKEFYRQLMSAYTVDSEKIKCNAKRRAVKKNGSSKLKWVSCVAACTAAAAAVTLSISLIPNQPGVDIVESGLDTAIERVYAAEERFRELAANNNVMDMYVSFEEEHTLNEIMMAFSAVDNNGDIKPVLLYTSEGKYYKYSDKINEDIMFRGAKITAPVDLYEELNRLKIVSLAEPVEGSDYTDKSFVPYVKKQDYFPPVTNMDTEATFTALPEPDASETTTSFEASQTTAEAATPTTGENGQGTLAQEQPGDTITIPVSDIKTAQFISNDRLLVTTSDSIRLFRLEDKELQLETTFYAEDAKITYTNSESALIYITACDSSGRNRLFCAEGFENGAVLSEIDISAITAGQSEIASVMCSDNGNTLIFKTVSSEKACIYYAVRNMNSISIVFSKEYRNPVSVISNSGETIYIALADTVNAATKIYSVTFADNSQQELAEYTESVQFIRNRTNDIAVIVTGQEETAHYTLLTPQGSFIDISGQPTFSQTDSSVFKIGKEYFRLENGALTQLDEETAAQYFVKPDYCYMYSVNISENGTAELIPILS